MQSTWQRILVIAMFLGAAILFAFFLYWFFFRPFFAPETPTQGGATTTPGQLQTSGEAGVRPISTSTLGQLASSISATSSETATVSPVANGGLTQAEAFVKNPAYFPAMTSNGQINYFNAADGKFYRISTNGDLLLLSDQTFFGAKDVSWDGNGGRAAIEFADGSNIVYDFDTKKQIVLPSHWSELKFTQNGENLGFKNMAYDVENRYLAVSKYDGSQPKIIESIGKNAYKVQVNWSPNNQVVAQYVDGKDTSRSEVYFVGQNKENFRSMIVDGRGFEGKWSPSGNQMLYSVYDPDNDYKPRLWVSMSSGENIGASRIPLPLETFVDKCAFANERYVLCGAPDTMPSGSGLDRTEADQATDNLWLVDLASGDAQMIARPQGARTIGQIMYTANDPAKIFFSEKNNNRIYQINLQ